MQIDTNYCYIKGRFCPHFSQGQCWSSVCPTDETTELGLTIIRSYEPTLPDELTINGVKYRKVED